MIQVKGFTEICGGIAIDIKINDFLKNLYEEYGESSVYFQDIKWSSSIVEDGYRIEALLIYSIEKDVKRK